MGETEEGSSEVAMPNLKTFAPGRLIEEAKESQTGKLFLAWLAESPLISRFLAWIVNLDQLRLINEPVRFVDNRRVHKSRSVGSHLPVAAVYMPKDIKARPDLFNRFC
jgi:hypothetical protein